MVVRCDNQVSESDQLRSSARESDSGDRRDVQPIPVTFGEIGGDYRYPGTVITIYLGTKLVYCGDNVNSAIDHICDPGGLDYELWSV